MLMEHFKHLLHASHFPQECQTLLLSIGISNLTFCKIETFYFTNLHKTADLSVLIIKSTRYKVQIKTKEY